jgi:phosphatidylserine/phosphatidylglycerophosphate/cardiolipin synthase-like enzyme
MTHEATLELRYSPKGGCSEKLVQIIDAATSTIRAMVYGATLEEVSDALLRAGKDAEKGGRGLDVKVILDRKQTKTGDQAKFYDKLEKARGDGKIEVRLYTPGGWSCMHHKVGIFDGKVVTTGSFNWTKNAQDNNNENLVAIENRDLAEAYTRIFDELWKIASPEGNYRSVRRFGRFMLSFLPITARYYPANQ